MGELAQAYLHVILQKVAWTYHVIVPNYYVDVKDYNSSLFIGFYPAGICLHLLEHGACLFVCPVCFEYAYTVVIVWLRYGTDGHCFITGRKFYRPDHLSYFPATPENDIFTVGKI